MRSKRFEKWFAKRNDLALHAVVQMWASGTYVSDAYHVELAWASWREAIDGIAL
jgi:hypothetical protein